jgi:ABC-type multidrug transport system fused ATPase/permease subunit
VLLLLLTAAPTLLWKLSSPSEAAFIDQAWFDLVARGFLLHLFYLVAPYAHVLAAALAALSTLLMYGISRWRRIVSNHLVVIDHFFLAVCLVLIVQLVTSLFIPITLVIQLQIIRAGLFASLFGYLYFIAYLYHKLQTRPAERSQTLWQLGLTVATPFAFLPLIVDILQRLLKRLLHPRVLHGFIAALLVFFAVSISPMVTRMHLWDPSLNPWGLQDAWYDAQMWARQNTPKDALFITPPEKWGIYDSDWRVFSERGTIAEHADLLMVALVPDYTATWSERFERVAPGAIAQFNGNYFENARQVKNAYYTLSEEAIRQIAIDYGASYLVLEKPQQRDFSIAYENEEYVIYLLEIP